MESAQNIRCLPLSNDIVIEQFSRSLMVAAYKMFEAAVLQNGRHNTFRYFSKTQISATTEHCIHFLINSVTLWSQHTDRPSQKLVLRVQMKYSARLGSEIRSSVGQQLVSFGNLVDVEHSCTVT